MDGNGYTIRIPWTPHAKQRAKVGRGHGYTPAPTVKAEKAIKQAFEEESATHGGIDIFEGPLSVNILMATEWFDMIVEPIAPHTHRRLRGDVDNYAKTILDSLNEVAWVDDKQIGILRMEKL